MKIKVYSKLDIQIRKTYNMEDNPNCISSHVCTKIGAKNAVKSMRRTYVKNCEDFGNIGCGETWIELDGKKFFAIDDTCFDLDIVFSIINSLQPLLQRIGK